jgi:hypothetical protein
VTFLFNPRLGTILVGAELTGPSATTIVALALDTGASGTTINVDHLRAVGIDPTLYLANTAMATGSGVVNVAQVPIPVFKSLGRTLADYQVYAHTLPLATMVDGVLGLDFFRDSILTLDFQKGEITLQNGAGASP